MGKVILSPLRMVEGFINLTGYISYLSMSGRREFIEKLFLDPSTSTD